jgi:hypothetical protein
MADIFYFLSCGDNLNFNFEDLMLSVYTTYGKYYAPFKMIIKIVKNMRNVLNIAKEKSKIHTCIKIFGNVGPKRERERERERERSRKGRGLNTPQWDSA